jgi:hypothetical protein
MLLSPSRPFSDPDLRFTNGSRAQDAKLQRVAHRRAIQQIR